MMTESEKARWGVPEPPPLPRRRPSFGGLLSMPFDPSQQPGVIDMAQGDGSYGVLGPPQPQGLLGSLLGPGPHPVLNWAADRSAAMMGFGLPLALSHWEKDALPMAMQGLQAGQQTDFARRQSREKQQREAQQQAALDKLMAQMGYPTGLPTDVAGSVVAAQLKPRNPAEAYINAGNGQVYDAANDRWISAPGATGKPPNIETLYGPHGEEVKGFWAPNDPRAGADGFVRLPGAKAPSGTRLSVGPDGQVEFVQGGAGGDLTTSTRTGIQGRSISAQDAIARLNGIAQTYKPEYSTMWGQAGNAVRSWQSWLFGEESLSPKDRAAMRDYATWRSRTASNLNQYLHDMSGAAITPQEADRLIKALPSDQDDPISFKAKLDDVIGQTQEAIARYQQQLQGQPGAQPGSPSTAAPEGYDTPRPRAVNKQTGAVVEWDGTAWVPVAP